MTDDDLPTRSVDSNLFITVSGPPGCGATTVCEGLSTALDCGYVSGGDIFRELADDRGMSLSQLIAKTDETDEIDRALDRRLRTIAEKWGASNKPFVLESRLAGWLAGNRADLRVWLDAPDEVRVERTADREEMEAEMRVREVSEAGRYRSYYGIDVDDRSFYDLAINTARWSPESTLEMILSAVEEYDPEVDEGAFHTDDIEV
ncbi:cytidylate kinase [Halobellus salinus]|uniref:Cytidylate kinase n=1 Tax=Halobellus salinus TaxID=931585 RepID=A0A830EF49_9EURY|nr:AAA family ATPase [Halobellus salinus]GGJ05940.1 cytidylate kinase [Halobellus salinus]SMP23971.1 cytidylate kinase [Halobellus salinus]